MEQCFILTVLHVLEWLKCVVNEFPLLMCRKKKLKKNNSEGIEW
jgi:hypothetical protein